MRREGEKGRPGKLKLGQFLLQEKLVTREQLEEALKSQAIFGGRLGSYLVEAGVLQEERLAALLSRKYRVPFARSSHFAKLPPDLINCIPAELAGKHLVLPLKKVGRRLDLAMSDPGDLRVIEEIGFRTGCIIRPVVAPETVILTHLRRYYGICRTSIYIPAATQERPTQELPAPADEEEGHLLGGPEQEAILEEWERKQFAAPTKSPSAKTEPSAAPAEGVPPISLDEMGRCLAENLERERMADIVAAYLAARFTHAALFLVRKNRAIGWRGVARGRSVAGFEALQMELGAPSVLQTVAHGKNVYLGPLLDQAGNRQLLQTLGSDWPEQVLVTPILLSERLIGQIYVDDRNRLRLSERMSELQRLATILAMGLEILILKNRLTVL